MSEELKTQMLAEIARDLGEFSFRHGEDVPSAEALKERAEGFAMALAAGLKKFSEAT